MKPMGRVARQAVERVDEQKRMCRRCGQVLPISRFKNVGGKRQRTCITCHRSDEQPDDTKQCLKCGETLPVSRFEIRNGKRRGTCKKCRREGTDE